ncbi:MAG: DUF4442 domain-containing protein [Deltaproteobacteria bacterium]|nr:DUF4442 domain-containing protein [Deltaproteobacteria bacterium]
MPKTEREKLSRRVTNPWLMRVFLITQLPLGWFAGLRVRRLEPELCEATVPYGWRTKNPFRSTYFAAQSMAAELSTGALAMVAVKSTKVPVAMLIVDMEGTFGKKATSLVTFRCEEGSKISAAVQEAERTGDPVVARVETVGRMGDGTEVSRFHFTWSFKRRSS